MPLISQNGRAPGVSVGTGSADLGTLDDVANDIYVNSEAPSGGDGSQANPFNDLQDAYDYLYDRSSASGVWPTQAVPATVILQDSSLHKDEGYHVRTPYTRTVGRGRNSTSISFSNGFGILVSNATKASVAAFIAANKHKTGWGSTATLTHTEIDNHWSDLVADPVIPVLDGVMFENLEIESTGTAFHNFGLAIIGCGSQSWQIGSKYYGYAENVTIMNAGIYLRNTGAYHIRELFFVLGWFRDVQILRSSRCEWYWFDAAIDGSGDAPLGAYAGRSIVQLTHNDGSFSSFREGVEATSEFDLIEDLSVADDSALEVSVSTFNNVDVSNPTGVEVTLRSATIKSDLVVEAGGTKTITLRSSPVYGDIIDPDESINYATPSSPRAGALPPIWELPLNEGSGTSVASKGPLGYNGTLIGGATWVAGEGPNSAAVQCAANQGIELPANITELVFGSGRGGRCEVRFKCPPGSNTADIMSRIGAAWDSAGDKGWYLKDTATDNGEQIVSVFGDPGAQIDGSLNLRTGDWVTAVLQIGAKGYACYADVGRGLECDAVDDATGVAADTTADKIIFGNGGGGTKDPITIGSIKYFLA